MGLEKLYDALAEEYGHPCEMLEGDPQLTAELMKQYLYGISEAFPQEFDTKDTPAKKIPAGDPQR